MLSLRRSGLLAATLTTAVVLGSAASARADQCLLVDEAQATAALEFLAPGAEWVSYCAICGDTAPLLATVTTSATAQDPDLAEYWNVLIDGEAQDLAYVFVDAPDEPGGYTNLALLVGCPTTDVGEFLPDADVPGAGGGGGTDDGTTDDATDDAATEDGGCAAGRGGLGGGALLLAVGAALTRRRRARR